MAKRVKKKGRFWKKFLIGLVSIIALLYLVVFIGHNFLFPMPSSDQPTLPTVGVEKFEFGAGSKEQPKKVTEYIQLLAQQVKNYNKVAADLWPDNKNTNQYVLVQDSSTKEFSLISPQGDVTPLGKEEVKKYDFAAAKYNGGWSEMSGEGIKGAYLYLSEKDLTNYYRFEKYYHIGSYDAFITYAHELFHSQTQLAFAETELPNAEQQERLEDTAGRARRMQLTQQLELAISADKSQRKAYLLDALATYQAYEKESKEDFEATKLSDRLEGTAYYYELLSSLYAGYPDEIHSNEDAYRALGYIVADDNPAYRDSGAVIEGYAISGFSGILLDLLALEKNEDPVAWKKTIEKDSQATPLTLLMAQLADEKVPAAKPAPSEKDLEKWMVEKEKVVPTGQGLPSLFYQLDLLLFFKFS